MTITTRAGKGTELTHDEMDTNFTELRDRPNGQVYPKTAGIGIKLDTTTPVFGWHDLNSPVWIDEDDPNKAAFVTYRGNIKARKFTVLSSGFSTYHLPHDYVPGTDIFIHVHWSHNSSLVTGGSVTWGLELSYAKGYAQETFSVPKTVSILQNTSIAPYTHLIAEAACSTAGGSGTQLDTSIIQTDGLVLAKIFLDSNDITVSSGPVPDPFVHMVDIHYQSTGLPTRNRNFNFWS